ncbi:uncharacterized protein [Sinocyclocheilus grahami]|uniref:uncharacterized protein n=1 Tax=Sinocyclocheilus grahami TaxID=75366 RepID=UPI0007ACB296|nr:PREDICTED: uncharacterized protein LOC107566952 [Sinocyclocheilus grahami]
MWAMSMDRSSCLSAAGVIWWFVLEVWHFMRRFAAGLHTDSHLLYGLFMAKLSACIFVWEEGDVSLLREAKRRELEQQQGIRGLTDEQLTGRLTSRQLAQHCRRCTRGVEETEQLIGQMLEAFKDARETMGIPLMDQERMDVSLHTDSHPLYGLFMAKLSACIFVWDEGDVSLRREAKRRELEQQQGIRGLTDEQLTGRLTSRQLAQHCRRCTRGVEETEQLIGQMLEAFKDARETMGIPLMDQERMDVIWDTQRRHLPCIQDPPGVQLYTQTGSVTKRGLTLPVYRCARGSTALESFHNHLNRFIQGKITHIHLEVCFVIVYFMSFVIIN